MPRREPGRLTNGPSLRPNDLNGVSAKMVLTRGFRESIRVRAQRDPAFRKALSTEALNAYLNGEEATGKAVLKDLINATVGFEELARLVDKPSKSLYRMLGPNGNP